MMESNLAGWNSTLRPSFWRDGVEQVDVDALDGLAVAGEELVRARSVGVGADGERALVLDRLRHHRGGGLVDPGFTVVFLVPLLSSELDPHPTRASAATTAVAVTNGARVATCDVPP